ncbi:MAG: diaminopimelate decarboxylase [Candidatus Hydrogenedentes bacterium]|nr:diaminopimelate decarboxylase [Candidatus Hydrogenedentota bacterium]
MALRSLLTEEQVLHIQRVFGTPVFVYDQRTLESQARQALALPNAFGLTVRYAMKALPNRAVIQLFAGLGLHIDASSGFEARRAMLAGVPPDKIQITAQEMPCDLDELLDSGVRFNACSLHQLRTYGGLRPGSEVSVRINPGLGTGHSNRTNAGGPSASFGIRHELGIWHEHIDEAFAIQREYGLRIARMHTHIGSGSDPEMWNHCAGLSLDIAARLPEVHTLSLGGGFKVARMEYETSADLQAIGRRIVEDFQAFRARNGRALKLEIEPGTFLVANAGALVCTIIDIVDTGPQGFSFIKVDSGMTELVRPSMYGAQHPIGVVRRAMGDVRGAKREYLVAGHCCESGDVLTPEPGNPEGLQTRTLPEAQIGDALVVGGAGAYAAAMSSKNYNSFPEAPEVLLRNDGLFTLIRKRQTLEQMLENEAVG